MTKAGLHLRLIEFRAVLRDMVFKQRNGRPDTFVKSLGSPKAPSAAFA